MNEATRLLNPELFPPNPVGRMLDEHEAALRTNRSNDGRPFQKELEGTADGYRNRGIATFRKVDPPVRLIYYFDKETKTKKTRTIFMTNPFLDFVGAWTARHGRALVFEAKSTSSHRLPLKRHGGLTEEQCAAVSTWRRAGAAVCVLWRFEDRVTLWTPEALREAELRGDKSLVFEAGLPVPRGEGLVFWDFLPVLERAIWPPAPAQLSCE